MTVAYLDSSALVKLVIDEPGSEDVATLWDGADAVTTSRVAHPEVRAAIAAAHRDGRLDAEGHLVAKTAWQAFHQALRLVELTPQLEAEAGDLAERHALGGYAATHLASVLPLSELPLSVATWTTVSSARSAPSDSPRSPRNLDRGEPRLRAQVADRTLSLDFRATIGVGR